MARVAACPEQILRTGSPYAYYWTLCCRLSSTGSDRQILRSNPTLNPTIANSGTCSQRLLHQNCESKSSSHYQLRLCRSGEGAGNLNRQDHHTLRPKECPHTSRDCSRATVCHTFRRRGSYGRSEERRVGKECRYRRTQ